VRGRGEQEIVVLQLTFMNHSKDTVFSALTNIKIYSRVEKSVTRIVSLDVLPMEAHCVQSEVQTESTYAEVY